MNMEKIINKWVELTEKARIEAYITYEELLEIFRETHRAFYSLKDMESVPREACQLIMIMDEFAYYTTIMDENYRECFCPGLFYLNYALKNEFFKGKYRSKFFMGPMPSNIKQYVLDIENISLDDFTLFLKDELDEDYNDVVFADNNK